MIDLTRCCGRQSIEALHWFGFKLDPEALVQRIETLCLLQMSPWTFKVFSTILGDAVREINSDGEAIGAERLQVVVVVVVVFII